MRILKAWVKWTFAGVMLALMLAAASLAAFPFTSLAGYIWNRWAEPGNPILAVTRVLGVGIIMCTALAAFAWLFTAIYDDWRRWPRRASGRAGHVPGDAFDRKARNSGSDR